MRRWFSLAAMTVLVVSASVAVASAQGAAPGVQVSVLTTFAPGNGPSAVAATNTGDVVAAAGPNLISVGPNGQQKLLTTIPGGAFGGPIGVVYDGHHQLYAAVPESFGIPQGTILNISPNGKQQTPVPGSEGMVAP